MIHIRSMEWRDAKAVVEFTEKMWKIEYVNILSSTLLQNFPRDKFEEGRTNLLNSREVFSLIVTDNSGAVIGFCDAGSAGKPKEAGGEIYTLYVDSSHQGLGLGKNLFLLQYHWLKRSGCKNIVVWTLAQNHKSRMFYEKMQGKLTKEEDVQIFSNYYSSVKYEWT